MQELLQFLQLYGNDINTIQFCLLLLINELDHFQIHKNHIFNKPNMLLIKLLDFMSLDLDKQIIIDIIKPFAIYLFYHQMSIFHEDFPKHIKELQLAYLVLSQHLNCSI